MDPVEYAGAALGIACVWFTIRQSLWCWPTGIALCDTDAPWVDDGQRYLPHRRAEFLDLCVAALEEDGRPYARLRGPWEEREAAAVRAVEAVIAAPESARPARRGAG